MLERLVLEIFRKKLIGDWDAALRTFYSDSVELIHQRTFLPDKVYSHKSILDEFSREELLKIRERLEKAKDYTEKSEWDKLFGMGKI